MENIYWICLVIGIILLLLSLLSSGISDIFSGGFNGDFGSDLISSLIPISSLEIFSFLIGFGGMGMTLVHQIKWHIIPATGCGLLLTLGTYSLLRALKKVENFALQADDLIGMQGTVVVSILDHSFGSVSFDTKVGKITYTAKSNKPIRQGTPVRVIAYENNIMIVVEDLDLF